MTKFFKYGGGHMTDFKTLKVGDRVALNYADGYSVEGSPNPVLATIVEMNPPNSHGDVNLERPCFDAMPDGGTAPNDAWTVFESEQTAGYVTVEVIA
jgi:hypothetical protein